MPQHAKNSYWIEWTCSMCSSDDFMDIEIVMLIDIQFIKYGMENCLRM